MPALDFSCGFWTLDLAWPSRNSDVGFWILRLDWTSPRQPLDFHERLSAILLEGFRSQASNRFAALGEILSGRMLLVGILDLGCARFSSGRSSLDSGFWILDSGCARLSPVNLGGLWILDLGFWMRSLFHAPSPMRTLGFGFWNLDLRVLRGFTLPSLPLE